MTNRILYHLGNLFILASLVVFFYVFFPFVSLFVFSSQIQKTLPNNGTFITIPKINAQAPIIENVDAVHESIYHEALKKGVAQAKGTAFPGEKGTSFLFAHSSGLPWELTRYNTIFLRLGELEEGDEIILVRKKEKFVYKMQEKKEVWPTEVNYLLQTKKNQIILQTCTPIGTSFKRLLIFASPA